MTIQDVAEQMLRAAHRLPVSETSAEGFALRTELTASDGNRYAVVVEAAEGPARDFTVSVEPVEGGEQDGNE